MQSRFCALAKPHINHAIIALGPRALFSNHILTLFTFLNFNQTFSLAAKWNRSGKQLAWSRHGVESTLPMYSVPGPQRYCFIWPLHSSSHFWSGLGRVNLHSAAPRHCYSCYCQSMGLFGYQYWTKLLIELNCIRYYTLALATANRNELCAQIAVLSRFVIASWPTSGTSNNRQWHQSGNDHVTVTARALL